MTTPDGVKGPVLSVRNVTVAFGGLVALSAVDLDVQRGSITGLIGPNGAGKTTLFNVLSGFVPAKSGTAALNGADLLATSPAGRPRLGLARTFQTPQLAPELSAIDNASAGVFVLDHPRMWLDLFIPPSLNRRRQSELEIAARALEQVDPTIPAEAPVGTLSLAHRRMTEVARAVCSKPELLLLDEPFAGLHDAEREVMQTLVRDLAEDGMSILIIEHNMEVVLRLCGEVYVLNFGHVIGRGTPKRLLRIQK